MRGAFAMMAWMLSALAGAGCASRACETRPQPLPERTAPSVPVAVAGPGTSTSTASEADPSTATANRLRAKENGASQAAAAQGSSVTDDDATTTERIRKLLLDDKTLSFGAKNVEVSTRNGKVTLRGTVPNEQERQVVEDGATKVVGTSRVDNQIQVRD